MSYFEKKGWVVKLNDPNPSYATEGKILYEGELIDTFKPSGMDFYSVENLRVSGAKKPCFIREVDRNGLVDLFIYSPSGHLLAEIENLNINHQASVEDAEGRIFEVEFDEICLDNGIIHLNGKEITLIEGEIVSLRLDLRVGKHL